jgi:ketosteroid isomerase-like protein
MFAKRAAIHPAILTSVSDRDEKLVREALDAWNRGDWDAVLEHCDPDIEWRTAAQLLDLPQVSHGHEGVREFWRRWTGSWTAIRAEVEDVIEVDDGLLALIRWRARSTTAGLDVDQPVAFHFEIHDHLLTRFVSYWERPQAFEALGLRAHD